jgi:hypothetical protein
MPASHRRRLVHQPNAIAIPSSHIHLGPTRKNAKYASWLAATTITSGPIPDKRSFTGPHNHQHAMRKTWHHHRHYYLKPARYKCIGLCGFLHEYRHPRKVTTEEKNSSGYILSIKKLSITCAPTQLPLKSMFHLLFSVSFNKYKGLHLWDVTVWNICKEKSQSLSSPYPLNSLHLLFTSITITTKALEVNNIPQGAPERWPHQMTTRIQTYAISLFIS